MKKNRRIIALLVGLIMCLSLLAACGNDGTGSDSSDPGQVSTPGGDLTSPPPGGGLTAPPPPDEIVSFADHMEVILDNNNIAVINPFSPASASTPTQWAFRMIYDRLIVRDNETGEILPELATRWETTDAWTYTFWLREDVYFHNGDKFTARDVENTILLSREAPGTRSHDAWRPVETINVVNDYQIQLVLNAVNVDFPFLISTPPGSIVNRRAIEANPETGPWVGTGAYTVTGFVTNDSVTFERNDNYWGDAPLTRSQSWRFIPEMGARTIMMQNGESDICHAINAEDVIFFQNDPDRFNIVSVVLNAPHTVMFNMEDPLMADRNFRMAVAHAMNGEELAIFAAGDWSKPDTTGTVWGYATEFRNNDIPMLEHDLAKAKAYLDASIYNGETVVISTAILTFIRASQALQTQLAAIGINIEINQMDPPSLFASTAWGNNSAQMIFFSPGFTLSAISARDNYIPGGVNNRGMYNNPTVTEMFDRASTMTDANARRALYMDIQRIIAEDPPYVNAFWRILPIVAANGVGGVSVNSDTVMIDMRYMFKVIDD